MFIDFILLSEAVLVSSIMVIIVTVLISVLYLISKQIAKRDLVNITMLMGITILTVWYYLYYNNIQ